MRLSDKMQYNKNYWRQWNNDFRDLIGDNDDNGAIDDDDDHIIMLSHLKVWSVFCGNKQQKSKTYQHVLEWLLKLLNLHLYTYMSKVG